MTTVTMDPRVLTELDHRRIHLLLASKDRRKTDPLGELLDAAEVLDARAVPADVVTMYSQVRVEQCDMGAKRKLVVCYPEDADPSAGFVSVLSPVGTALLGRRCGDIVQWTTPSGPPERIRIVEILFQPEASGDYTL